MILPRPSADCNSCKRSGLRAISNNSATSVRASTSGMQHCQCHQWRRKRQQSRLIVQFQLFRCLFHLPTNNIGCMRITGGKLLNSSVMLRTCLICCKLKFSKMIEEKAVIHVGHACHRVNDFFVSALMRRLASISGKKQDSTYGLQFSDQ